MPVIKNGVAVRNVRICDAQAYVGCGHSKIYDVMKTLGIKPKKLGRSSSLSPEQCDQIADFLENQGRINHE
jgi:hypothetical protein